MGPAGIECNNLIIAGIRTDNVPHTVDGPSVVAAASALMLLPENASRYLRLHRMAALGMALEDREISAASSSAVRALLKTDDVAVRMSFAKKIPTLRSLCRASISPADHTLSRRAAETMQWPTSRV